jgi:Cu+-exporting ATPase
VSLTELGIRGMTCASCVAHVTRALRKVPGVEDAAVNLATERATILHGETLQTQALIAAVERAGYGATTELDLDREARERAGELRVKRRLLILAIALTIPVVVISMLAPAFAGKAWLIALLALPVWAVSGWPFHRAALAALRGGTATMDTLVSLGSSAAYGLGIYEAFAGGDTTFDTASVIITLIALGKYLEARARAGSSDAIRGLLALRPEKAMAIDEDGAQRSVPVELIRSGDRLAVAPGERIPVDGIVVEGAGAVDRSMLTGESIPIDAAPGTRIEQGTLSIDGALVIRATAVGAGTELSRIVEIVRRASGTTPPVQRLADRVAGIFVPAILIVAALTLAGWLVTHHAWTTAIVDAVAVLVVACPCALGLATPTATIAGVGAASRRGVLFKDAVALERAALVSRVYFDKTGTLTNGHPAVVATSSSETLVVAAAIERASTHPLARAIVAAADGMDVPVATDVRAARGLGMSGTIDGDAVLAGQAAFLREHGIDVHDPPGGRSVIFVARAAALLGSIECADVTREDARLTVSDLRVRGIASELLSGDASASVSACARDAGIDRWHARLTPEQKAQALAEAQKSGAVVAFVGDGINDAPALAQADIGFAMGAGTAVAIETAGAALLSNDPHGIVDALDVARATMRTIKQNLFWAFAYNVVLVPLAALGIVAPMLAAAAMGLSSLFVVGNSLRLARR